MRLLLTPTFECTAKKLHRDQKTVLDEAARIIVGPSKTGETEVLASGKRADPHIPQGACCPCWPTACWTGTRSSYSRSGRRRIFCRDLKRTERRPGGRTTPKASRWWKQGGSANPAGAARRRISERTRPIDHRFVGHPKPHDGAAYRPGARISSLPVLRRLGHESPVTAVE